MSVAEIKQMLFHTSGELTICTVSS